MNIKPVGQFGVFCCPFKQKSCKKDSTMKNNLKNTNSISYPKGYYLSFGARSYNLEKAYRQIQERGGKLPETVESRISEMLDGGSFEDKTLKDIHTELYSQLHCCDNIEELREFFPEFADVKYDDEFEYVQNPNISQNDNDRINKMLQILITQVKNGNNLEFSQDQDLSLQLVKMYWADGLSQEAIAKKLNVPKIYVSRLFKGLNIPSKNVMYAQFLKYSDPEYNAMLYDRLMTMNSARSTESARKKLLLSTDKRIANGESANEVLENIYGKLQGYCNKHPNIPYFYTAQDYKYFAANPTQAIVYTQVMLGAWYNKKAERLYEDLQKFLGKDELTFEDFCKISKVGSEKNKTMEDFWTDKHKRIFSDCLKDSMKHQKYLDSIGEIFEPIKKAPIMPEVVLKEMNKIFTKEGQHDFSLEQASYLCYYDSTLGNGATVEQGKAYAWIGNCFSKNKDIANLYSNIMQTTHFVAADELLKKDRPDLAADILAQLSHCGDTSYTRSYRNVLNKYFSNEADRDIIFAVMNSSIQKASKLVVESAKKTQSDDDDVSSDYEKRMVKLIKLLEKAGYYKMQPMPNGLAVCDLIPSTIIPESDKRMRLYVLQHPKIAEGLSEDDIKYFKAHPDEEKCFFKTIEECWQTEKCNKIREHFVQYINLDEGMQQGDVEYIYRAKFEENDSILEDFFKQYPQDKDFLREFLQYYISRK